MNIPAIETSVLPPLDSYLDRDNIFPEDGDQPPPPLPAEIDPIWCHQGASWPYCMCLMLLMEVVGLIPNPLVNLRLLG